MAEQSAMSVEQGEQLVMRHTRRGVKYGIQRTKDFNFLRGEITGYALNARLAHRYLARIPFKPSWVRTLNEMIGTQDPENPGLIHTSQRALSVETDLSTASINEALQYWQDIRWVLMGGTGGRYALNPWLFWCGSSGTQEAFQNWWLDETDNTALYLPDKPHPEQWLLEYQADVKQNPRQSGDPRAKKFERLRAIPFAAEYLTRVEALPSSRTQRKAPATSSRRRVEQPGVTTGNELFAERLRREESDNKQRWIELALSHIGDHATPTDVMALLSSVGPEYEILSRETVKSALRRAKLRKATGSGSTRGRRVR